MGENTREIVLDILLTLEREKEYSHRLIKAVLDKYDYLDSRDKAFIKRLTEGTIERKMELDYYLNRFSSVPVRKMKPLIRCLLRMSVYQLLYMDNVPDSSVCNEACKLAGKRKFVNLKGFVNGILRNISKQKDALPMPDMEKNPEEYFSIKYSMPEWIVRMWLEEYGRNITVTLLEGLLAVHPVQLRFSTKLSEEARRTYVQKIREAGVQLRENPYLPYVYTAEGTKNISSLPGFEDGVFTVQDVSSALCVEAAGITEDNFVLDICAAPGGKSMLASEKAGRVIARDVSENKVLLMEENLRRMKADNVTVQAFDATMTDESLLEKADVVLMDLPCSGLGVMGKKRDIKYNASPEGIASIVGLQKEILEKSWRYVKPGGVLVYSTCTINRTENEDMVRYISEKLPFVPEELSPYLPAKLLEVRDVLRKEQEKGRKKRDESVLTEEEAAACIQMLPGYMESDGFFIARFRRREE